MEKTSRVVLVAGGLSLALFGWGCNPFQAAQDKIDATQADKAAKAAEGEKRKAADAEKLRQKQEAHARKLADKMREAERREAEAARK